MQVHKALLISTTCQRLGLGTFIFSFIASTFLDVALPMNIISLAVLILLGLGGIASAFHLGRPNRFFNAFSNFKSHLTQEAFVTPFLGIALLVCGLDGILFDLGSFISLFYWITIVLSILFLISTGLVYQLSSRPAWDTPLVLIVFLLTAAEAGSIATIAIVLGIGETVPLGLVVLAFLSFALSLICQFFFTSRLKTVGYGVDVFVNQEPFRATYMLWVVFGLVAFVIALLAAVTLKSAIAAYLGVISAVIGIFYWTILFYKVALKVKMFPMYDVDLNLNM